MKKTLADIYYDAWMQNNSPKRDFDTLHLMALEAVASAVRKRVKRKIASDARKKAVANSKWVLR